MHIVSLCTHVIGFKHITTTNFVGASAFSRTWPSNKYLNWLLLRIGQFWRHGWFNYKFWKSRGPFQTLMWTNFKKFQKLQTLMTCTNMLCVQELIIDVNVGWLCTHDVQHTHYTQMHMNINPLHNCKILPTNDNLHTLQRKQ